MSDDEMDAWEATLAAKQQRIEAREAYLQTYGPFTA